ncbi:unnamed protein product [Amoebophrya sp. A120]|nr:unnamed protein product [Amoebophrya sp. A120]|eukprot:GSA120T00003310001.1
MSFVRSAVIQSTSTAPTARPGADVASHTLSPTPAASSATASPERQGPCFPSTTSTLIPRALGRWSDKSRTTCTGRERTWFAAALSCAPLVETVRTAVGNFCVAEMQQRAKGVFSSTRLHSFALPLEIPPLPSAGRVAVPPLSLPIAWRGRRVRPWAGPLSDHPSGFKFRLRRRTKRCGSLVAASVFAWTIVEIRNRYRDRCLLEKTLAHRREQQRRVLEEGKNRQLQRKNLLAATTISDADSDKMRNIDHSEISPVVGERNSHVLKIARPIVFVPGYKGSTLRSTKSALSVGWGTVPSVFKGLLHPKRNLQLACEADSWDPETHTLATDEFKPSGLVKAYRLFGFLTLHPGHTLMQQFLRRVAEEENRVYYEFVYDWRRPALEIAEQLRRFVDQVTREHEGNRPEVVAHSFGALLVLRLLHDARCEIIEDHCCAEDTKTVAHSDEDKPPNGAAGSSSPNIRVTPITPPNTPYASVKWSGSLGAKHDNNPTLVAMDCFVQNYGREEAPAAVSSSTSTKELSITGESSTPKRAGAAVEQPVSAVLSVHSAVLVGPPVRLTPYFLMDMLYGDPDFLLDGATHFTFPSVYTFFPDNYYNAEGRWVSRLGVDRTNFNSVSEAGAGKVEENVNVNESGFLSSLERTSRHAADTASRGACGEEAKSDYQHPVSCRASEFQHKVEEKILSPMKRANGKNVESDGKKTTAPEDDSDIAHDTVHQQRTQTLYDRLIRVGEASGCPGLSRFLHETRSAAWLGCLSSGITAFYDFGKIWRKADYRKPGDIYQRDQERQKQVAAVEDNVRPQSLTGSATGSTYCGTSRSKARQVTNASTGNSYHANLQSGMPGVVAEEDDRICLDFHEKDLWLNTLAVPRRLSDPAAEEHLRHCLALARAFWQGFCIAGEDSETSTNTSTPLASDVPVAFIVGTGHATGETLVLLQSDRNSSCTAFSKAVDHDSSGTTSWSSDFEDIIDTSATTCWSTVALDVEKSSYNNTSGTCSDDRGHNFWLYGSPALVPGDGRLPANRILPQFRPEESNTDRSFITASCARRNLLRTLESSPVYETRNTHSTMLNDLEVLNEAMMHVGM